MAQIILKTKQMNTKLPRKQRTYLRTYVFVCVCVGGGGEVHLDFRESEGGVAKHLQFEGGSLCQSTIKMTKKKSKWNEVSSRRVLCQLHSYSSRYGWTIHK